MKQLSTGNRLIFVLLLSIFSFPHLLQAQKTSVQNIDRRVEELLVKMTVEEKIGQLNQIASDINTGTDLKKDDLLGQIRAGQVGSVLSHINFENKILIQKTAVKESRLGIPVLFGFDVIHGYKTIFPIPLAQAASWNLGAIEAAEHIAAMEAAADGQNWTFSPMVDVTHDPRWGRIMEGAGEDPWLGSRIAEARVRGFQGADLSADNTLAACAKHFAGYGFIEGGREYNSVDISDQRLHESVLPPFKAAADAGVATFMCAFNTLNGVPTTMSKYLLTDILRDGWGWPGMVVSDWNSIGETLIHGTAIDDADASAKCLSAGCDMDMAGRTYQRGLKTALQQGRVTDQQLDAAVRRVLRLKFMLGLMDDPFRYLNPQRREQMLERPEYRQAARALAAESMVLLKNGGGLLPLDKDSPFKKIALIGPYANSIGHKDYMSFWTLGLGNPAYDSTKVVTPAQALVPALEEMGFEVTYTEVCLDATCTEKDLSVALQAARAADLVIALVGEQGLNCGESRSVSTLELPRSQEKLLQVVARNNKPSVVVLFNSRPLVFPWALENVPAILVAWQPGYETGNALADILTGAVNPSGKLPVTFPRRTGQIPMYYNHLNTGRPQEFLGQMWTSGYLDLENSPAFPFGFGLSYTTFAYSGLQLSKPAVDMDETLEVSVRVTNTGKLAGQEVVQLYVRDLAADISRPVRELKGFEKITLAPGASRTVVFKLTQADLAYRNPEGRFKADPGMFQVFVGGSSADGLTTRFELR
ncbi:MAG: beta-glucosidase BglX [Bacteroidetes bacterium]|nr:MAG: beta-glucosidase BglX [Bacteroidota bacterium]